jgi:hypothetical protein
LSLSGLSLVYSQYYNDLIYLAATQTGNIRLDVIGYVGTVSSQKSYDKTTQQWVKFDAQTGNEPPLLFGLRVTVRDELGNAFLPEELEIKTFRGRLPDDTDSNNLYWKDTEG